MAVSGILSGVSMETSVNISENFLNREVSGEKRVSKKGAFWNIKMGVLQANFLFSGI